MTKPTLADCVVVINDFIDAMNGVNRTIANLFGRPAFVYDKPEHLTVESVEEWLDQWEAVYPGFRAKFDEMAHKQLRHRLELDEARRKHQATMAKYKKCLALFFVLYSIAWAILLYYHVIRGW